MSESEFERLKDRLLGAERAALDAHAARLAELERERQRIEALEQARKELPRRLPQLLERAGPEHGPRPARPLLEAALRDLRLAATLAARDTPVSRLDPRAKVLVTAAFLVAVASFGRYAIAALAPFALYPLWLAVAGRVPARWLLRKLAIAAPFAAMVAIANPILDTAPMLRLADATVSAGWVSFASILARVALTVAAALAVAAGTGMPALAAALASLGVPRVFTGQLLFLWRYAFVLGGEASRMQAARTLRGGRGSPALAVYGPLAGHLLLRAFERGERIHRAMRARGHDGEIRTLREPRSQAREPTFVIGWCAYFVAIALALG